MTKAANAENLRQYEIRFSLIVWQILALFLQALTWLESKNSVSKFQTNCVTISYVIEYSRLDG